MPELIAFLTGFVAAFQGLACFALAIGRHWREAMSSGPGEREAPRPRAVLVLRASGIGMIAVSLALMVWGHGPGFGFLLWLLTLCLAGYSVVALLALKPALLRPIARLC
jgi:hypothetical protein